MTALAKNLKLVVDGGDGGSPTTTAGSNPTSGSCEWEGHCAGKNSFPHTLLYLLSNFPGASCKDENDCSDQLVCKSGKCASH
jgi:chitosanase